MTATEPKKRARRCRCSSVEASRCWQFQQRVGGCPCLCHRPTERTRLIEACDRLLKVESEVGEMPKEQREWFFGKEGHRDCFTVARALKGLLG